MERNKREIRRVGILELHQHPENRRIYCAGKIERLKDCIMSIGLLQPIIINPRGEVLCGWRRVLAIILAGWHEVDAEVIDLPLEEEGAFIVQSNTHRIKTEVEIYNEIKVLGTYLRKKQGQRTDLKIDKTKEEDQRTRTVIAETIGISESHVYRNEFTGDRDVNLLALVDSKQFLSLNEAYNSCKQDKPKVFNDVVHIDLKNIKPCPFCGGQTARIIKDKNGNLTYKYNES